MAVFIVGSVVEWKRRRHKKFMRLYETASFTHASRFRERRDKNRPLSDIRKNTYI